jgi:hypothetical protein
MTRTAHGSGQRRMERELRAGCQQGLVRAGAIPGAGEAGADVVVRIAGDLLMNHTTGATAPAQHHSVGVTPYAIQDHDVARHGAKNPRPGDGRASSPR